MILLRFVNANLYTRKQLLTAPCWHPLIRDQARLAVVCAAGRRASPPLPLSLARGPPRRASREAGPPTEPTPRSASCFVLSRVKLNPDSVYAHGRRSGGPCVQCDQSLVEVSVCVASAFPRCTQVTLWPQAHIAHCLRPGAFTQTSGQLRARQRWRCKDHGKH